MNYFDLTNLCLQELNYKRVNNFSDLVKPDHKRILHLIKRINTSILSSCNWQFLQRVARVLIPPEESAVSLVQNARVESLFINNEKLIYNPDYTKFLQNPKNVSGYAVFNDKFLIAPDEKVRVAKVIYYTQNNAMGADGGEKEDLELEDDISLIPAKYVQSALVFGVCLQFKSNPEHPRFKYWLAMFNDAIADMRSQHSTLSSKSPTIIIKRGV